MLGHEHGGQAANPTGSPSKCRWIAQVTTLLRGPGQREAWVLAVAGLEWQRESNDGVGQIVTMRLAIVRFASDVGQISPRGEKNLSKARLRVGRSWQIRLDSCPEITLWSHFLGGVTISG